MYNTKGFTLVELLIAATIIGMLAVFATTQYRNSAAETRWTQAKAKADQLAYAIERARLDYPNLHFTSTALIPTTNSTCNLRPYKTVALDALVSCGYIENMKDDYFQYYACENLSDTNCAGTGSFQYQVAVKVNPNAILPSDYKAEGFAYYTSSFGGKKECKDTSHCTTKQQ